MSSVNSNPDNAALRRRLGELRENINEIVTLLRDPDDNGAWCLGDPYEALESMEREAAKIEYQLLNDNKES